MMMSLANRSHNAFTAHIVTFNTTPVIQYKWVTKVEVVFGEISEEILT